jgi:hypothetical protein
VGTGDNVMIGGFIVDATAPSMKVLVRAVGPTLLNYGISNAAADTTLALHDSNGNVTFNDNWRDTQAAEILATGQQPDHEREAAILGTLVPGNYTAVLRGKDETSGVALIEAYYVR